MAILTQILLIITLLATIYASFVHNREKYKEVIGILPDFRKLIHKTESAFVKVVVFVPDAHAEEVRKAVGAVRAGRIGNYSYCSFSSQGIGRFLPGPGAHPTMGHVGQLELVEEERIEFTVSRENLKKVIEIIKRVHPYDESVIDIYPLELMPDSSEVASDHGAIHSY